jgi:hypothetical protein
MLCKQSFGIFFAFLVALSTEAQTLRVPVNSSVQYSQVAPAGAFQLGLFTLAKVPLADAFQSEKSYAFRYDLPVGLSSILEIAFSLGYESFQTKDIPVASTPNVNQRVLLTNFPMMAHGRYVFYRGRLRADLDLGLGVGLTSITVTEKPSITNGVEDSASMTRFLAQTLVGIGLPWADGFNVYLQAGPHFDMGSEKRFPLVGGFGAITAKATNMSLVTRAAVKYEF